MRPQNKKRYSTRKRARRGMRKRNYRRQQRGQRRYGGNRVMRCPTSFPDRMIVKLSFGTAASTLYSVGMATEAVWKIILGCKPFEIPTGSPSLINPQGWDQWANVYDGYRPLGMKVRISIRSADNVARAGLICCYWSSTSTPIGTVTGCMQNRYTHSRAIGCDDVFEHSTYVKPWTILDTTKREYMSSTNFINQSSINPPVPANLFIHLRNTSSSNNLNLMYTITGTLYTEFRYPKTLLDS